MVTKCKLRDIKRHRGIKTEDTGSVHPNWHYFAAMNEFYEATRNTFFRKQMNWTRGVVRPAISLIGLKMSSAVLCVSMIDNNVKFSLFRQMFFHLIKSHATRIFEICFRYYVIFKLISLIDDQVISCENVLRWLQLDHTDNQSILVAVT